MTQEDIDRDAQLRAMAQKFGATASDKMGDLWRTFLIRGIVFLVLGLVALFWPAASVSILVRIFGLILALDGAANLLGGRRAEGQPADLAPSAIAIVLGIILLFLPAASMSFAFLLLGLWALVTGLGYLMTWWHMPPGVPERDTARNIGLFTAIVGVILIFWPGTGTVAVGWALAVMAFALAAAMLFLASRFRNVKDRIADRA